MIVKCLRLYNENTKEFIDANRNQWLTVGGKYNVLEINYCHNAVYYRVIPNIGGHPILIRINEFEVISGKIPKNWVLTRFSDNFSKLGPERWGNHDYWKDSFWEDWDNGEPEALECYEEELAIIVETDSDFADSIDKSNSFL